MCFLHLLQRCRTGSQRFERWRILATPTSASCGARPNRMMIEARRREGMCGVILFVKTCHVLEGHVYIYIYIYILYMFIYIRYPDHDLADRRMPNLMGETSGNCYIIKIFSLFFPPPFRTFRSTHPPPTPSHRAPHFLSFHVLLHSGKARKQQKNKYSRLKKRDVTVFQSTHIP